jgi:hypothetical protein
VNLEAWLSEPSSPIIAAIIQQMHRVSRRSERNS